MMSRPGRWQTRFGRWVSARGVTHIVGDLGRIGVPVTSHAVYNWIAGSSLPHPTRAIALVRISNGALSLDDVYGHIPEVRALRDTA